MKCELRAGIEKCIQQGQDPERAAIAICVYLDIMFALEGWLEEDDEVNAALTEAARTWAARPPEGPLVLPEVE